MDLAIAVESFRVGMPVKTIFGVHDSQILPIANYVDETRRSNIKDILALQAIINILQEAVTYIENI